MIKICAFCNEKFEVDDGKSNTARIIYCSYECRYKGSNRKKKPKPMKNLVCAVCGNVFLSERKDRMTCSHECRHERDKQLARERHKREKQVEEKFLDDYQKSKPKPKEVTPAHEIEAEARKRGMNYGMYYAMLQMEKERERRKK